MPVFEIKTARQFLEKLHEEQADFERSNFLSSRHAINAAITAYHLHEWVWADFAKPRRSTLWPNKKAFKAHLESTWREFRLAEQLTDGSKHFALGGGGQFGAQPGDISSTGVHGGSFGPGFSRAIDTSYLWVEVDRTRERAEDIISRSVQLWDEFFASQRIP
jgi:hypothetical protein